MAEDIGVEEEFIQAVKEAYEYGIYEDGDRRSEPAMRENEPGWGEKEPGMRRMETATNCYK